MFDSPTYSEETYAGYLNSGETVGVVEVRGDWAKITRDGKIGYTGSEYLTRISSENTYESRVTGYTTRCVTVYKGFDFFGNGHDAAVGHGRIRHRYQWQLLPCGK